MQSLKVYFLFAGIVFYTVFTIYTYHEVKRSSAKNSKEFLTNRESFTYVSATPFPTKRHEESLSEESKTETVMGASHQFAFIDSINEIRHESGLSDITTDEYSCTLADQRAREITSNFSHEGFEKRKVENDFDYPTFSTIVENIAMSSENNPIAMWLLSPTHKSNLLSDITYGCVGQSGSYFVFEGWKE